MNDQKYYKGFFKTKDPNILICRSFFANEGSHFFYRKKYTVGKEHRYNGDLKMCLSGIHCCVSLGKVDSYYPFSRGVTRARSNYPFCLSSGAFDKNKVYCEVIPHGRIIEDNGKVCCSRLYIKQKLNKLNILRILFSELYSNDQDIRRWAINAIIDIYEDAFSHYDTTIFGKYDICSENILSILRKSIKKTRDIKLGLNMHNMLSRLESILRC